MGLGILLLHVLTLPASCVPEALRSFSASTDRSSALSTVIEREERQLDMA